ncbi:MAG: DUF4391 domain-containing protein [Bacteroidales bacterium]|nr:DUF4391 domain-containing protein [Bacteroidales bacterium]
MPQSTEINKALPKTVLYEKFELKPSQQKAFDADVSRMVITNVLSSHTLPAVAEGKSVKTIYVVTVQLKRKQYVSGKSIELLSRLIPQKMVLVLHHDDKMQLAVHHSRLLTSEWMNEDDLDIPILGLDFDKVWENIVATVSGIVLDNAISIDEQLDKDWKRQQTEQKIAQLEKRARIEKQPRKKWELVAEIRRLEKEL